MAIANAIYSIEIRLKVLICNKTGVDWHFPSAFEIHDLEALLVLSGLSSANERAQVRPAVKINWDDILTLDGPNSTTCAIPRISNWSPHQAATFLHWLEAPSDGVLAMALESEVRRTLRWITQAFD